MSYLIRRVLAKPRLILDKMCRLYGKFASYLRRVLCKTRLIFPRINGPIENLPNKCIHNVILGKNISKEVRRKEVVLTQGFGVQFIVIRMQ